MDINTNPSLSWTPKHNPSQTRSNIQINLTGDGIQLQELTININIASSLNTQNQSPSPVKSPERFDKVKSPYNKYEPRFPIPNDVQQPFDGLSKEKNIHTENYQARLTTSNLRFCKSISDALRLFKMFKNDFNEINWIVFLDKIAGLLKTGITGSSIPTKEELRSILEALEFFSQIQIDMPREFITRLFNIYKHLFYRQTDNEPKIVHQSTSLHQVMFDKAKENLIHFNDQDLAGISNALTSFPQSQALSSFLDDLIPYVMKTENHNPFICLNLTSAIIFHGHKSLILFLEYLDLATFKADDLINLLSSIAHFHKKIKSVQIYQSIPLPFIAKLVAHLKSPLIEMNMEQFCSAFFYLAQCRYKDEDCCSNLNELLSHNQTPAALKIKLLYAATLLGVSNEMTRLTTFNLCSQSHNLSDSNLILVSYIAAFQIPGNSASHKPIRQIIKNRTEKLEIHHFQMVQQAIILTGYPLDKTPKFLLQKVEQPSLVSETQSWVTRLLEKEFYKVNPSIKVHSEIHVGYAPVDILITNATINGKKIIIEVNGAHHRICNTGEDSGKTKMKRAVLELSGYHIEEYNFDFFDLNAIEQFVTKVINKLDQKPQITQPKSDWTIPERGMFIDSNGNLIRK